MTGQTPAIARPQITPLPLKREEESHTYVWLPTQTVLAYSVTKVCKPEPFKGNPAASIRGTRVHLCLEHKLLGLPQPDWQDYGEFIQPLLEHSFWNRFDVWAAEGLVCDLQRSIGGGFDALGYDRKRGTVVLLDLKSKGSRGTYDVKPQLGAYSQMIAAHWGVYVDECRVMWAYPGEAQLGAPTPAKSCECAWADAWDQFKFTRRSFGA